ncbi:ty3-gypsy retrotransposon protein [Tanacetum coccineum]
MRVKAYVGKNTIHSLIDSGSAQNFLDLRVAKKLGCKLKATCPMDVSVANGQIMNSSYECKGFKWTLQGVEFTSDVLILPLGGTQKAALQWMSGKRHTKAAKSSQADQGQLFCVYPNTLFSLEHTPPTQSFPQINELLESYQEVFATPTSLPPQRQQDHIIPLLPNTPPINIRPYKYPLSQKDVVEAMVKELMKSGVIRDSHSPYSSPIVLVKKKNGTWRMCVDYRQLNKYTVKDKFPIPVVEELLDELHGAHFFSKLDLRSGHFTLVFFDDILVYSATLKEHSQHLQSVLQVMKQNSLYAKMSKCTFATTQVEYLGHIISGEGVSRDPSKIIAMKKWPTPVNVKQLRGFLGLTGYYRRFIKNYAIISKPLTTLLKKHSFTWNLDAQLAFESLKTAMGQALVLALPDFNKPFIVETDASGLGIGAVLQQGGHPITYLSKSLSPKHQALSTYEKEFYAVLMALEKWRGYLLDRHFKIKTDHFSLKYLLDQMVLSCVPSSLAQLQVIYHTYTGTKYTWINEELRRKGKLVVGNDEQLRKTLVTYFHSDPIGGHSGVQVTVKKMGTILYWRGIKKYTKKFVAECDVCQRNKSDLAASPGYLQPLPIPTKVWHDISMDFIEALPPSQGKTIMFVVVDRLSKYAHFIPMSHPFTARQVAQAFIDNVYKLHGLPNTIVSDRDKIFISHFWQSLFKVMKVQLNLSTAYHSQIDGQTEVVNKCVECFMRCMTGEKPKEWVQWVPLAEYWYNTNYYSCAHTTPFEIVYGQPPNLHLPYIAGTSAIEEVDRTMQAREQAIAMLQFHLNRSQDRIKSMADKKRSNRSFEVGMKVYLKLQLYR